MIAYEDKLGQDLMGAFMEASMHFDEKSAVFTTLRKITKRLTELNIPYAVVGGMALFAHGFRRFTEDVDLLVTPEGLKRIDDELEGLGYVRPFRGSKQLRDAETGVRIEFLVSGQYPGDGKPKPVVFPDPAGVGVEQNGFSVLNLATLVNLKLASGMTSLGRLKDLADVIELIRTLKLARNFGDNVDASVREKFFELWDGTQSSIADHEL